MTKNNKNIVIVGSGITGMIASILMRKKILIVPFI